MAKIIVHPTQKEIEVAQGSNLRTALIEAGFEINSPCGGCASCARCVIIVKSQKENLSDFSFEEKQLLGNVFHITGERLSCQTLVYGDVEIDVSQHVRSGPKPKTQRRSKKEAEQIIEERIEKAKERPQKQGGLKKPKTFKS